MSALSRVISQVLLLNLMDRSASMSLATDIRDTLNSGTSNTLDNVICLFSDLAVHSKITEPIPVASTCESSLNLIFCGGFSFLKLGSLNQWTLGIMCAEHPESVSMSSLVDLWADAVYTKIQDFNLELT